MSDFEIKGLREFQEMFKEVQRYAPRRIMDKVEEIGQDFKEEAIEETPIKSGIMASSYKDKPVVRLGDGYSKAVYNDARHFHLVEKGHNIVVAGRLGKGGRVIGWVDGRFMFEETTNKYQVLITPILTSWLGDLYKEFE